MWTDVTRARDGLRLPSDLTDREWALISPYLPENSRHVFVDGGYTGKKLKAALARMVTWTIQIFKRGDKAKGFKVIPRRWFVERTFAWLCRNRRLAEDFARTIESAGA